MWSQLPHYFFAKSQSSGKTSLNPIAGFFVRANIYALTKLSEGNFDEEEFLLGARQAFEVCEAAFGCVSPKCCSRMRCTLVRRNASCGVLLPLLPAPCAPSFSCPACPKVPAGKRDCWQTVMKTHTHTHTPQAVMQKFAKGSVQGFEQMMSQRLKDGFQQVCLCARGGARSHARVCARARACLR